MTNIEIIRKRAIINNVIYDRYFKDDNGDMIGVPAPLSIFVKDDTSHRVIVLLDTSKRQIMERVYLPRRTDDETVRCVQKKFLKETIVSLVKKNNKINSVKNLSIKTSKPKWFMGLEIPAGIHVFLDTKDNVRMYTMAFDHNKCRMVAVTRHCGSLSQWKVIYNRTVTELLSIRENSLKLREELCSLTLDKLEWVKQ